MPTPSRASPIAAALLLWSAAGAADCPPDGALGALEALPLERSFRSRAFELEPPRELYRKALGEPGAAFVERDGKLGQAVLLAPVPVEAFWMALNDDDHHDEGGHLPLVDSQVISGSPAAAGRETFQYFKKAGLGRWWVNRLDMNAELYRDTDGAMWELYWEDVLARYPGDEPPVEIEHSVPPLVDGLGGWLLIPLGDSCTLVEYAARGEPGGVVGALQFLAANRTIRNTLEGMLAIARGHAAEAHTTTRFVRPDGSPLADPPR